MFQSQWKAVVAAVCFNGATKISQRKVVLCCTHKSSSNSWALERAKFFLNSPEKCSLVAEQFLDPSAEHSAKKKQQLAIRWTMSWRDEKKRKKKKSHPKKSIKTTDEASEQTVALRSMWSPPLTHTADDHAAGAFVASCCHYNCHLYWNTCSFLWPNSVVSELFRFNWSKFSLSPPHLIVKYLTSAILPFFNFNVPLPPVAPVTLVHPNCQYCFFFFLSVGICQLSPHYLKKIRFLF